MPPSPRKLVVICLLVVLVALITFLTRPEWLSRIWLKIVRPVHAQRLEELEQSRERREARKQQLRQMSDAALTTELAKESRANREPFNSMTYRELITRGKKAVPTLLQELKKTDSKDYDLALLGLLALRKIDPNEYKSLDRGFRLVVLVTALKKARYFNTWGIPQIVWGDAAKALIDEDGPAKESLRPLLQDKRDALLWGPSAARTYQRYGYRVRDYAFGLIKAIEGKKTPLPEDPNERDKLIQSYLDQPLQPGMGDDVGPPVDAVPPIPPEHLVIH